MCERLEAWGPIRRVWRGIAFRFPEELDAPRSDVHWRDDRAPHAVVLDGGRVVASCHAATSPCASGAVEAGVETAPSHRRHGLGAELVAAWAHEVRRRGGIPLYSTSWDNRPSRALAHRLRLIPFASDLSLYV